MRDGRSFCTPKSTGPSRRTSRPAILLNRTPYGIRQPEPIPCLAGPDPPRFSRYATTATSSCCRTSADASAPAVRSRCWDRCVTCAIRKAVDESTDAWDTVDWLVKNVPDNNGKSRRQPACRMAAGTSMMAGNRRASCRRRRRPRRRLRRSITWIGDDFLLAQRRLPPELRLRIYRREWNCRPRWSRFPFDENRHLRPGT